MYKSKLDKRIQEERLQILIQNLPLSLISTVLVSVFVCYAVYDKVSSMAALGWIALIMLLSAFRLWHLYQLRTNQALSFLEEEKTIIAGVFLSGILFGSSVLVIFPFHDLSLQVLVFFLLSSMIAGSVAIYSTHLVAFLAYSTPIMGAFLYRAYTLNDLMIVLTLIGVVYYAVMLTTMIRVNRSILKSLKTQYLNYDLADRLTLAKDKLESSNNELQIENNARRETEKRLYRLANYDPLTGLANRHLFKENLKDAMKSSKENQSMMALLFLDLDNFKIINDTLGHAMGDKLLIASSSRLKSLLDHKSSIARLGGDEFVIIVNEVKENDELVQLAYKIIKLIEKPFTFNEHEMYIGTSIGISLYPNDTQDVETLLSYADTAMYTAKAKGKNNYQFFTSDMHQEIQFRHDIETKLHHAVENNELRIEYQPKINVKTKKVIGAEALLRWNQKELGQISPSVFIPIAEESSLINKIGKWVIIKVCEDISHIQSSFNNDLCISINISSSQILHQNLPELLQENLDRYAVTNRSIELEFTENMLIKQSRKSQQILQQLDGMGIKLSIDDFGTGYSSLNYLKTLPIHTLKIDKSFIRDMPECKGDCAIAKSIITLANNLNLEIVAEGVETAEQLEFLQENGCCVIQGFYFSKPLDINAFIAYLNTPKLKSEQLLSD